MFLSDLDDKKIMEITNLTFSKIKLLKNRMFSNPIYWEDSISNKKQFEKHVYQLGYNLSHGGRFTQFSIDYDKGKAIKKFLKYLIKTCLNILLQFQLVIVTMI